MNQERNYRRHAGLGIMAVVLVHRTSLNQSGSIEEKNK